MEKEILCGIYSIVCKKNNLTYIGQSHDIYKRWKTHKKELKGNRHSNYKLQKDFNKYGKDYFDFSIIKTFSKDIPDLDREINEAEIFYIKKFTNNYSNWNKVYNLTTGGDCEKMSDYAKKRLSDSIKRVQGKGLYQLDSNGKIIKYFLTRIDCIKELGLDNPMLYRCLKNQKYRHKGFIFIDESKIKDFNINDNKSYLEKKRKPIYQIDFDGNIVKEWDSINSASATLGFDLSGIGSCLRHKYKTFKGYIWYFKDDFHNFELKKHFGHAIGIKRFGQYDLNNNLIKIWNKTADAIKMGYSGDGISCCLRGKHKTHKGYMWKYIDKEFYLVKDANYYDSSTHKRIVNYEV